MVRESWGLLCPHMLMQDRMDIIRLPGLLRMILRASSFGIGHRLRHSMPRVQALLWGRHIV